MSDKYSDVGSYRERTGIARELCNVSGVLKFIEIILIITTLLIHRYGDMGNYVFFGTTMDEMAVVSNFFAS